MNLTKEMILEELDNKNLNYGEYETSLIVDYLSNLYELNLLPKNVTYKDTTCYSHFGKPNLPWEKLDKVNILEKEIKKQ